MTNNDRQKKADIFDRFFYRDFIYDVSCLCILGTEDSSNPFHIWVLFVNNIKQNILNEIVYLY